MSHEEHETIVSCMTWVRRGVAKEHPEKIKLSKDELEEIFKDSQNKTDKKQLQKSEEDNFESDDNSSDGKDEVESDDNVQNDDNETLKEKDIYNLENYDEDDEEDNNALLLGGLTYFASNDEDPHMTVRDEDDNSETEDLHIKPNDNLIVVGVAGSDCSVLEVYVYNENDNDLFVHHDLVIPEVPLCVEWLDFDPGEASHGNFIAVGSMKNVIDIWDLDIIESLEPMFVLGKKRKKYKEKSSKHGHSDAILDLSWNKILRNVLASGSADNTVCLWDLSSGKCVGSSSHYGKVQSIKWHPFEPQSLLTGSCDGNVRILDCCTPDKSTMLWECEGEVELVLWNHFDPFYCLACTSEGLVYNFDTRISKKPIWKLSAHSKACTGLVLSSSCPGMLVTSSVDNYIKVWDTIDGSPVFVAENNLKMGKICSLSVCPDSPFIMGIGGDSSKNRFRVVDFMQDNATAKRFGERQLLQPILESKSMDEKDNFTMETANVRATKKSEKMSKHDIDIAVSTSFSKIAEVEDDGGDASSSPVSRKKRKRKFKKNKKQKV